MHGIIERTKTRTADRQLKAVLELCDRMDADPMNGGVVLTDAIRAAVRRSA